MRKAWNKRMLLNNLNPALQAAEVYFSTFWFHVQFSYFGCVQHNKYFFGGKLEQFGLFFSTLPTNLEAVLCFMLSLMSVYVFVSEMCKKQVGWSWWTDSPWPKDQWISLFQ